MKNIIFIFILNVVLQGICFGAESEKANTKNTPAKKINLSPIWHSMELSKDSDKLEARESIVDVNGTRFRKIEYENKTYLIKFTASGNTAYEDDVVCGSAQKKVFDNPNLVEVGVKVTHYSRVFLEGVKKVCVENRPQAGIALEDPQLGIAIKSKNPNSGEKKVLINPVHPGLGFKSDW